MSRVKWLLVLGVAVLVLGCSQEPQVEPQAAPTPTGVLLPYPEEGRQYRMTEVCDALTSQGYEVRATLHHEVGSDVFDPLLEDVPGLVRRPLENYLADGIMLEFEIQSLCQALADR